MTKLRSILGIAIFLLMGVANAQPSSLQQYMQEHHDKTIGLLFMHQAKQALIKPLPHSCYRLTLLHTKPNILYFSNRPKRFASYMSIEQFIKFWSHSQQAHNAVLQGERKLNQPDSSFSRVVTIANPRYNAGQSTLTYKACITDKQTESRIKIKSLSNVTLFVDDFQYGYG